MDIVLIFMALALYLIWGDTSKPPAKPKPPAEKWVETDRKRTTVIEERPVKTEKK